MEVINTIDSLPVENRRLYLALGNFDGIHRGHQAILRAASEKARCENGVSAALIFNPHPSTLLRPDEPVSLLTDLADRADIMADLRIDYMIIESFTEQLAALEPERFIKNILVDKLSVKAIFVGENYRFGRNGSGNAQTLSEWGKKLGFYTVIKPLITYKDKSISSSLIRNLILEGAVKESADYLNYYFYREGTVCRGSGLGHKLVYPTANIYASENLLWPGKGVYLTAVGKISDQLLYGVTNVGPKPTFNSLCERSAETHILDFNQLIYGKSIRLCFIEKLRDIRIYSSPQLLKEQIGHDIKNARNILKTMKPKSAKSPISLQEGSSVLRSH
jgi:riboflavin kinase / FMN adenylyltransferase